MWITKEVGLGLVALVELAAGGRASAEKIAAGHQLSVSFLRKVLTNASRAGLVKGRPGRSGGYQLVRDPELLSVREALERLGWRPTLVGCTAKRGCASRERCPVRPLWEELEERMAGWLDEITIADLVERRM
ncbi:MAG: RrF2 family transcriptional regulator [Candidatus Bipolaricaulaceae bacterium]